MDFTSRKLVRRARIRRNHERQVRVAAVKSRKRTLQSSDPLEQLLDGQDSLGLLEGFSNSTQSTTVPSFPSLSGSQSLTASTTSRRARDGLLLNKNGRDISQTLLQSPHAGMNVATPYPGQFKGVPLLGSLGKQRQRRGRKSDHFDDCVSDSNLPTEATKQRGYKTKDQFCPVSGHLSDSAVSNRQQQQQHLLESEQTRVRKHGRVRPQAADAKRKRARQLEKLKPHNSKIETVLEEEVPTQLQYDKEQLQCKDVSHCAAGDVGKPRLQREQVSPRNSEVKQQHHPVIANVFPSNPPSPTLSRMVRQKTEGLNISENTLQQIKEMSSHLRIVNWLWDSTQLPLEAGRKARSCRGASPSAATTVTTTSDNLVVVRGHSDANWFDLPRENYHEQETCRQEQLSPVSIDSDFKSDYEDELMSLV